MGWLGAFALGFLIDRVKGPVCIWDFYVSVWNTSHYAYRTLWSVSRRAFVTRLNICVFAMCVGTGLSHRKGERPCLRLGVLGLSLEHVSICISYSVEFQPVSICDSSEYA